MIDIQIYSAEEVAELLKISVWQFNKMCREGRIKARKIGRGWKVTKESLERFLEGRN